MTAKTKTTKKKKTKATKKAKTTLSDAQKCQMIQETAFFLAEARGFIPGHEIDDWIMAEQRVENSLQ